MRQPDWDWPIWIPRARPFDWAWDLDPWDFADPAIYRRVRAIEDGIEAAGRELARMRDEPEGLGDCEGTLDVDRLEEALDRGGKDG